MRKPARTLERAVLRPVLGVLAGLALLGSLLGWARLSLDVRSEEQGALALADLLQAVRALESLPEHEALERLSRLTKLEQAAAARHVQWYVERADGQRVAGSAAEGLSSSTPAPGAELQRRWALARPDGPSWQFVLQSTPESEQREALGAAAGLAGLFMLGALALGVVLRWTVRRSLQPLAGMVQAVRGLARPESAPALSLSPSLAQAGVAELQTLGQALQQLSADLTLARAQRQRIAQQVHTLQEDERQRLARELHDEFGQRLTAMRVDAAWLARRLRSGVSPSEADAVVSVIGGIGAQCERIQQDVRTVLRRLQPWPADAQTPPTVQALIELLEDLVRSWQRHAGGADARTGAPPLTVSLDIQVPAHLRQRELGAARLLALYRISQEALTNAARHAQARHVRLHLSFEAGDGAAPAGERASLLWAVEDDGIGVADLQAAMSRGNGLAGLQQRLWSMGADLQMPGGGPGLRLAARCPWPQGA